MDIKDTSKILVQELFNERGEHLLRIQAGPAVVLDECFTDKGIIARKMPEVEIDSQDESVAWMKVSVARECLSEGLIVHSGLRQAVFAALRGCGQKITVVQDVSLRIPDDAVRINNCHVATNLDSPGMEYVCNMDGEVIADLYCGEDHIPDVPIAFFSLARASTKDWLAGSLRDNLRIGNSQEQADNDILQRWGGGEWMYLDEDLLPFEEYFPWSIFGEHLHGRGKVKLEKHHFEQAIKDALYARADSEMEKRNQSIRQAQGGSIHDVPWRQYFVDDAIHRHPDLVEKDYGNNDTFH